MHSMNDENNQKRPGIDYIVPLDKLEQFDINSVLKESKSVDCRSINWYLDSLKNQRPEKKSDALDILVTLASFCLVHDDKKNPFKPVLQWVGGSSPSPSDFMEEQIDIIAKFTPVIDNPGLRARLADVSWLIQRKRQDMAEIAIDAYCESVENVRKGEAVFLDGTNLVDNDSFCDDSAWGTSAKYMMARAAQISHVTKWKLEASQRFKTLLIDLLETADEKEDGDGFYLMGTISLEYGKKILPIERIAEIAEKLAEKPDTHPDLQANLFRLAKKAYQKVKNEKKVEECGIAVAECSVKKADFAISKIEEAEHLLTAILSLMCHLRNTKDRRRELTDRLQKIQPNIRNEMRVLSVEVDLEQVIKKSTASVCGRPWQEAFYSLMQCDVLPTCDEIHKAAFDCAQKSLLQMLLTRSEDEQLRWLMNYFRIIQRQGVVHGVINPKREVIASEHQISIKMISNLLQDKPFIADDHKDIYIRAIFYFLQGKNIEAASLLVPQLENSLRHVLASEGHDTTKIYDKDDQTGASLHILLDPKKEWRQLLETIIPPKYILEIDLLFNYDGGPSIRKKIAHGNMPDREFQEGNCIYAVWLIIYLALFFPEQLSE